MLCFSAFKEGCCRLTKSAGGGERREEARMGGWEAIRNASSLLSDDNSGA